MDTSKGTSNLNKSVKACLKASGQTGASNTMSITDANTTVSVRYSPATHRALIALQCAKNFRPFNMVTDDDYIREVFMLRPNTHIPDPATISRDIKHIYNEMSVHVKGYFKVNPIYINYAQISESLATGKQWTHTSCA